MDENHATQIHILMDELLARLKFDIEKQPPHHLPAITAAITHLYQVKNGMIQGDEKQAIEITLLKNINNQVRSFGNEGGEQNGGKAKI